jgi:hypothetical protein
LPFSDFSREESLHSILGPMFYSDIYIWRTDTDDESTFETATSIKK